MLGKNIFRNSYYTGLWGEMCSLSEPIVIIHNINLFVVMGGVNLIFIIPYEKPFAT